MPCKKKIIAAHFKVKKNDVFLFGISFFASEIFTFLNYANEESDDVTGGSTKTVQHSIKNIWRKIRQFSSTWHQKCISQKQQSDTCRAIAMTTVMPLVLF